MEEDLSQSPTQPNDGRSYDQYARNDTQLSHDGDSNDYRTLHDDDTGAVRFDFDPTQRSLDEPALEDIDELATRQTAISQDRSPSGPRPMPPPQTPAALSKLFQQGTNETLMGPSQLFRQDTSAIKKASPTSSRPSPNIFNQINISPNPVIPSSPLKDRGLRTSPTQSSLSSPAVPCQTSRPSDPNAPSSQSQENDTDQIDIHTSRTGPEPITEYRPSRDSDTYPSALGDISDQLEDQYFDSLDAADIEAHRSHIARLKRTKADISLTSSRLPQSTTNFHNVEVPSTGQCRSRKTTNRPTDTDRYLSRCQGKIEIDKDDTQETVANSQDEAAPASRKEAADSIHDASTNKTQDGDVLESTTPVHYGPPESTIDGVLNWSGQQTRPSTARGSKEMIPETSPSGPSIRPPRLIRDILNRNSSNTSDSVTVSIPEIPSSSVGSIQLGTQRDVLEHGGDLPPLLPNHSQPVDPSLSSVVPASSQPSISRRSARLRNVSTPLPSTAPQPEAGSKASTLTSTLTTLSSTPNISSSITPNTEADGARENQAFPSSGPVSSGLPTSSPTHVSSPAEAKVQRRGRLTLPRMTYSSISVTSDSFLSRTRRSSRRNSLSTDELAKSPSSSAQALQRGYGRGLNTRRSINVSATHSRPSREPSSRRGIFEGMVFAISFQGRQVKETIDQYNARLEKGRSIERVIRQEGGRILESGFNELFQFDSLSAASASSTTVMPSSLRLLSQDTGFTALIADGHSRKVKYMQALALGLPCLAPKWITSCVAKRKMVDWSSYLLCAGQSALLGDAIRSRNLSAYDAATAKLAEVIGQRPKLLEGTQILLIMKKTKNEDKRQPYVLLARVLGGTLIRVNTLEEARAKLLEREDHAEPFNWVYVDDHMQNAEEVLFGSKVAEAAPRKRKRHSVADSGDDRPPKRIRVLSDEFVVQSLILGRLVEDDETIDI